MNESDHQRLPGLGYDILDAAGTPRPQGMTLREMEKDNCGVGAIARLDAVPTHDLVEQAIQVMVNMEHRGATGGDGATGDGAGLLMQLPDAFFRRELPKLPAAGDYAVGMFFLPTDPETRRRCQEAVAEQAAIRGMGLIAWRDVPCDPSCLGGLSRSTMPFVVQAFLARGGVAAGEFERRLYVLRRLIEKAVAAISGMDASQFYVCSLSSRLIIYKGMLLGSQVRKFFPDLARSEFASAFAVVHQRYSTNTLPEWRLAQPFRHLAHNGEINTLRGNVNRLKAREAVLASPLLGADVGAVRPVVDESGSDSAMFDNALELLLAGGRSLPHAMMMMVPEAWGSKLQMSEDKRAFYEFHSAFQEPWDGPAALVFCDGRFIGGTLDRNGLRPCRYTVTRDGLVLLSSETGVLDIPAANVRQKGRLQAGRMFLVDLEERRIVPDHEIKSRVTRQQPYRTWVRSNRIDLRGLMSPADLPEEKPAETLVKKHAFGYTEEELKVVVGAMAASGQEPVGSMGNDTPLAVLSSRPQLLFNYFKQLFAQVTNPPIDPLREELVMSLTNYIGRERNLLAETPEHFRMLKISHPVLTPNDLARLRRSRQPDIKAADLDMLFEVAGGGKALEQALQRLFWKAEAEIQAGATLLILTDRGLDARMAPIPALLAASGLHHHLIRRGLRTQAAIIVESGEPREVIHFAMLSAFGANAVCPHAAFSVVRELATSGMLDGVATPEQAVDHYIAAVKKGLLKTFSRMGISTIRSFFGSQIFEAVGLGPKLVSAYFPGTVSRIGGIGLDELAAEIAGRHAAAFPPHGGHPAPLLDLGGHYSLRLQGERHLWTAEVIANLQQAVRHNDAAAFKRYVQGIDNQQERPVTLRSLFSFTQGTPVPLAEVEPAEAIIRRFVVSAMSFGSLSREAHETIAAAMNQLGAWSNCGEGGEDPARYRPRADGANLRSRVKQVASGRFGVTTEYLVNADELQIKVAQGAKPGEGGQLPGHKVSDEIARVRHTTSGVTLISPPPHHDIYSIEDLAQLIYDLKCVNRDARVSVKLVSEAGVGTIASGVAKARADMVLIAGYDGGTGASPLTAIRHAGLPWELGLAEAQQSLRLNGLRDKIRVQVDGQLRTGRDLAIATLLGAEEFGFATVVLVSLGCTLMRKCHLNTCPFGVATQDEKLRARFNGDPEHIVRFFRFLAEDFRQTMAALGYRTVEEMVGHTERLSWDPAAARNKAATLDFSKLLDAAVARGLPLRCQRQEFREPVQCRDDELLTAVLPAIEKGQSVELALPVRNTDRSFGSRISGEIARRHGHAGLKADAIDIKLTGSAGQSLGAFLASGVSLTVVGEVNDHVGKGMSGGRIVVMPPADASFAAADNVIAGNVVLYGATGGEVYINGIAGERFAVRNSGARAVVEGVGDHACEYMTGGIVAVLGPTGVNFAAGMSGGIAYVYDVTGMFDTRCNLDMVDLEPVRLPEDVAQLRALLETHVRHTGSAKAKAILGDWEVQLAHFVKVMPIDYRQALARMKQKSAQDDDTISATEEVFVKK